MGVTIVNQGTPLTYYESQRKVFRNPRGQKYYYALAYSSSGSLWYLHESSNGSSWSGTFALPSGMTQPSLWIWEDSSNSRLVVYIAYMSASSAANINLMAVSIVDSGTSPTTLFAAVTALTKTDDGCYCPSICLGSNGYLWIVAGDEYTSGGKQRDQVRGVCTTSTYPVSSPSFSGTVDVWDATNRFDDYPVKTAVCPIGSTYGHVAIVYAYSIYSTVEVVYSMKGKKGNYSGSGSPTFGTEVSFPALGVNRHHSIVAESSSWSQVYVAYTNSNGFAESYRWFIPEDLLLGSGMIYQNIEDSLCLSLDETASPDKLVGFYAKSASSGTLHYKTLDVETGDPWNYYASSNYDTWVPVYSGGTTRVGQRIWAPAGGTTVTYACFYLKKVGSPAYQTYAKVFLWSDQSQVAVSNAVNCTAISATAGPILFTFPVPPSLDSGVEYAIVFEYSVSGDASNHIVIGVDTTSPTHPGQYTQYSGTTWYSTPDKDTPLAVFAYPTPTWSSETAITDNSSNLSYFSSSYKDYNADQKIPIIYSSAASGYPARYYELSLAAGPLTQSCSQSFTITSAPFKLAGKPFLENPSLTGIGSAFKLVSQVIDGTLTFLVVPTMLVGKVANETPTLQDLIAKSGTKLVDQSGVLSDAASRQSSTQKIESSLFSDTVRKGTEKKLLETSSLTGSLWSVMKKIFSEVLTLTDIVTPSKEGQKWEKELVETLGLGPLLWFLFQKRLEGIHTSSDTFRLTPGKGLQESQSLASVARKEVNKIVDQSFLFTPSLSTALQKFLDLGQSFSLSDVTRKLVGKTLAESSSVADALAKVLPSNFLEETISFTDLVLKRAGKFLSQESQLQGVVQKGSGKALGASHSLIDILVKETSKVLSESWTLTPSLSILKSFFRFLYESLTSTGEFSKIHTAKRVLEEAGTFSTTLVKKVQKTFFQTMSPSDILTPFMLIPKTFLETFTVQDSRFLNAGKGLAESWVLSEAFTRVASYKRTLLEVLALVGEKLPFTQQFLYETLTLVDVLSRVASFQRILPEEGSLADFLRKTVSRSATESIILADLLPEKRIGKGITGSASLSDLARFEVRKKLSESSTHSISSQFSTVSRDTSQRKKR